MGSITTQSYSFADVRAITVKGHHGLVHRLIFNLNLHLWSWEPYARRTDLKVRSTSLDSIQGDISLVSAGLKLLVGPLQILSPGLPLEQRRERSDTNILMSVDLTRAQLEEIERRRSGGDLTFALLLRGSCTHWFSPLFDAEGKEKPLGNVAVATIFHEVGRTVRQPLKASEQLVPVPQGEWVRVLGEMGYQRTLLLEIPILEETSQPELARASASLKEAQKALLLGHYRDVVGKCRDVFEHLWKYLGVKPGDIDTGAIFRDLQKLDLHGRFGVLMRAAYVVTHVAHHNDEAALRLVPTYDDAMELLTITAAMLRKVSTQWSRAQV